MIIDCHGHLASEKVLPPPFFEGWAKNAARKLGDDGIAADRVQELLLATLDDEDCSQLLAEMEEAAIDRTVLLVIDFAFAFPDLGFDIEAVHNLHRRAADRSGRLITFSGVDPRRGKSGVDLLETAIRDWHFRGFKIYPPCGFSPSDPALFPFYEVCRKYRVPVLTHIGPTSEALSFAHTTPMDVDGAAKNFPEVNFILAHAGLRWRTEAALLAEYRSNVYLDMSGFQDGLSNGRFRECLAAHLRDGLSHKLLFGIDWPIHRLFGSQKRWVEAFKGTCASIDMSAEDLERVMWRNFSSILEQKGT